MWYLSPDAASIDQRKWAVGFLGLLISFSNFIISLENVLKF